MIYSCEDNKQLRFLKNEKVFTLNYPGILIALYQVLKIQFRISINISLLFIADYFFIVVNNNLFCLDM